MDLKTFKAQRQSMAQTLTTMRDEKTKRNNDSWFPTLDKMGNGYAVIRILPQKDVNKHPVVVIWKHKSPLKSLLCPSNFGTMKDCPLCQQASREWSEQKNRGIANPKVDSYRKQVRVCNILIRKDPANPENNGKIFKFYLPKEIVDKIDGALFPPADNQGNPLFEPRMIHDPWEGADLTLCVKKGSNGYNSYADSNFAPNNTPLAETEEKIEEIYNAITELEPNRNDLPADILTEWNNISSKKVTNIEEDKQKEPQRTAPTSNVKPMEQPKPVIQESEPKPVEDDEDDKLPWD